MTNYFIDASSINEAYQKAVSVVIRNGIPVESTVELDGLLITEVKYPVADCPIGVYTLEYLEEYSKQMIHECNNDFKYTYGNRLRRYGIGLDQLDYVINTLSKAPETRRAVSIVYNPEEDMGSDSVPCMTVLDFKIRNERLHLVAYFRSHDIYGAYPANLFGLARLMEYVIAGSGSIPDDVVSIEVKPNSNNDVRITSKTQGIGVEAIVPSVIENNEQPYGMKHAYLIYLGISDEELKEAYSQSKKEARGCDGKYEVPTWMYEKLQRCIAWNMF